MFEAHSINAEHKDLIHDVAYDFYGQRMATCSSDQFVKVWDQDEQENWRLTANWKAHSGSVWKVTWAHPDFGQVLATCSFDRTAAVWEEIVGEGSGSGERGLRHWVRRTNLVDSRTSVTDVKFGPKSLGLLLATSSADGVIRIYEAPDIMNLSQWTLQHEILCKLPCSCLSWNTSLSRLHPPMLAVGSDDPNRSNGGKVLVYEYSENSRRWTKSETLTSVQDPVHDIAFAPNMGRSYHMLAVATKDVKVFTFKESSGVQSGTSRYEVELTAQFEDHYCSVWRVTWNVTGTILASSGDDGCVRLWKANYKNVWKCLAVLKGDGTQAESEPSPAVAIPATSTISPQGTARYYKLGTISHANQLQSLIYLQLQENRGVQSSEQKTLMLNSDENNLMENDGPFSEEESENDNFDDNFGLKKKREIRDYNESSAEKNIKNETENKLKVQKSSTESSSMEKSEFSSKEGFFSTSNTIYVSSTRKPHLHRKHRKSRIGSAERFFTETHSTTSTPIQVRQSRTKITQAQGIDKAVWLQSQKFQQYTSPNKDTITKEEALLKGYGRHLDNVSYHLDTSKEKVPDALSYNMITIHFSADTSHYSRERDPHYFGNGRMQIKSEVYKDWKPAHWTQGIGMSKYFHLHQGRVSVSTTGIYLIYAQIQYSNVQEVNGFSVFRNKEVVVQCITTSTHPDKHEIKSNTCGISTTILLQSNDSVCIKDLHHGRYVVLTPEKSYFGLVLLSPFKN